MQTPPLPHPPPQPSPSLLSRGATPPPVGKSLYRRFRQTLPRPPPPDGKDGVGCGRKGTLTLSWDRVVLPRGSLALVEGPSPGHLAEWLVGGGKPQGRNGGVGRSKEGPWVDDRRDPGM